MGIFSARKSPYPYHFKIGDTGLLLGTPGPNRPALVSSKAQDIAQVSPPDFSYAGTSPIGDRDEPYESLTLGMGLQLQERWQDFRYSQAEGVDLSVWPWCKGPEVTQFTPGTHDSSNGARAFFELGGVLYSAQGHYILRRVSDSSWTVAKDFGADVVLNVAVFTSNFDGNQRVFVALQSGLAQYSSDGTVWTPMATFHALAFAVIGREFWWADDVNQLRKCDTNANPTVEANYTSLIFRAGDKSSAITSLMVTAAGTLIINKTDGLYTLDQAGDDHALFPFLKFAPEPTNGKNWGQFENDLYVAYGNNFSRLDPSFGLTEIGPERLVNNTGPVRGRITAFVGVGTMFAYAGILEPDTVTAYLMKFGGFVTGGQGQQNVNPETVRVDAWHGSITRGFSAKAIQSLFVSSIGAPAGGHTRTYIGFSDGTLGWMTNPCVPNPAACEHYRFETGDGWVDLPRWHGGYHASLKSLRHFAVTGTRLDANNYVTLEYKTDPSQIGYTALSNVFDSATYETAPFPSTTSTILADFRIHLHNTSNSATPLVSAVAIGHALRPKRYMQVELTILCADGLVRRDGVPLRIGRRHIQQIVEQAVDSPGAVHCTMPDESVQELSFTDYAISQSFDEVGRQWRGSLTVKAVQFLTTTTSSS